jgi:hypothetical protein
MPTRPLLLATLAAALLAAAPAAQARIVPNKGMAGVRLGMTAQRVLKILGSPSRDITNREGLTIYTYRHRKLRVTFTAGRYYWHAFAIYTWGRKERTRQGIGVGSRESTLRHRLRGEQCLTNSIGRYCILGGGDEGVTPETDFRIRHHRVVSVNILRGDY